MGQGLSILQSFRHGRIILHPNRSSQSEARQGGDLQFVFQKSDIRAAVPCSGQGTINPGPTLCVSVARLLIGMAYQLDRFCDVLKEQNAAGELS